MSTTCLLYFVLLVHKTLLQTKPSRHRQKASTELWRRQQRGKAAAVVEAVMAVLVAQDVKCYGSQDRLLFYQYICWHVYVPLMSHGKKFKASKYTESTEGHKNRFLWCFCCCGLDGVVTLGIVKIFT